MKEIKKIVITSSSGWGMDINAFEEKLTLTDHSISFKHSPQKLEEERECLRPVWNQELKWSYKTDSKDFSNQFFMIPMLVSDLFKLDPKVYSCTDVGETSFSIFYSDGHKEQIEFWYEGDLFYPVWKAIRGLIPSIQDIPNILSLPSDDDFDEDEELDED